MNMKNKKKANITKTCENCTHRDEMPTDFPCKHCNRGVIGIDTPTRWKNRYGSK